MATAVAFFVVTLAGVAQAEPGLEYKLETAFIYQFTNYIEWPTNAAQSGDDYFTISVVGSSPVFQELEELAKAKSVKGKKIKILKGSDVQFKKSHIIFVATPDEALLRNAVEKSRESSALIVSYGDGFAKKGAMINFFLDEGRLRFEINRAATEARKLQISSQLLKLARLVE